MPRDNHPILASIVNMIDFMPSPFIPTLATPGFADGPVYLWLGSVLILYPLGFGSMVWSLFSYPSRVAWWGGIVCIAGCAVMTIVIWLAWRGNPWGPMNPAAYVILSTMAAVAMGLQLVPSRRKYRPPPDRVDDVRIY